MIRRWHNALNFQSLFSIFWVSLEGLIHEHSDRSDSFFCRQVMIWNMETYDYISTSEEHSLLITDVRFRPNSAIFATSSFDRSVQIWDADKVNVTFFLSKRFKIVSLFMLESMIYT